MKQYDTMNKNDVMFVLFKRFKDINKTLLIISFIIGIIGTIMLYGSAGGSFTPWAGNHFIRLCAGVFLAIIIGIMPIHYIYKPAYIFHLCVVMLLIATDLFGDTSKGAERWLAIGLLRIQPSEFSKISTILALGRFFHEAYKFRLQPIYFILVPIFIILVPMVLILKQPDLGTALLMCFCGLTVMIASGIDYRIFIGGGISCLAALPIIWANLKTYQKNRVLIFLDPEKDPLGTGYHISQAKIAFGSGGFSGRGFMRGPQAMLEFLPEKHTDFAFTAYAEQFGFFGSICLLILFSVIITILTMMCLNTRHIFGKLVICGITANFFFYVFINMAMVMGLTPVVGVPLPMLSYGGSVMITIFISYGIALNLQINDDPTPKGL
jgi:rod shape determining protein RodA